MLYTSFFGLNEEPFGVTPDPKFLYLSPKHEEAIATLTYGITHNRGFIMLTGEIGSGKTTVLRHVFEHLAPDVRTALVLNPKMNALELLNFINSDFGLDSSRNATHKVLMDELNEFLLECHRTGEKVVLAIDEAQEMSTECLEFIRLLSNLETDTSKLIQIILIGQPELREIVGSERLRQLDQRIAVRYHLEPLDATETANYIRHRINVAGSTTLAFPEKGVKAIHGFSHGIPRLINLACDRVLLASFAHEELQIRATRIKDVLKEFRKEDIAGEKTTGKPEKKARPERKEPSQSLKPALAGLTILAVLGLLLYAGGKKETTTATVTNTGVAAAAKTPVEAPEQIADDGKPAQISLEKGIYMAPSPLLCKEASLMNLLGAWGESRMDAGSIDDTLGDKGYAQYELDDPDKITKFGVPVMLELREPDMTRHVTLRWIVGGYAVILDPEDGKQIVPFSWVKDKAVRATLLYRKGDADVARNEKALTAVLAKDPKKPSLTP